MSDALDIESLLRDMSELIAKKGTKRFSIKDYSTAYERMLKDEEESKTEKKADAIDIKSFLREIEEHTAKEKAGAKYKYWVGTFDRESGFVTFEHKPIIVSYDIAEAYKTLEKDAIDRLSSEFTRKTHEKPISIHSEAERMERFSSVYGSFSDDEVKMEKTEAGRLLDAITSTRKKRGKPASPYAKGKYDAPKFEYESIKHDYESSLCNICDTRYKFSIEWYSKQCCLGCILQYDSFIDDNISSDHEWSKSMSELDLNNTKDVDIVITMAQDKGVLILKTPFNATFVSNLKEVIDSRNRRWNSTERHWEINIGSHPDLERLCKKYFRKVTFLTNKPAPSAGGHEFDKLIRLLSPAMKATLYKVLAKHLHPDVPETGNSEAMLLVNKIFK